MFGFGKFSHPDTGEEPGLARQSLLPTTHFPPQAPSPLHVPGPQPLMRKRVEGRPQGCAEPQAQCCAWPWRPTLGWVGLGCLGRQGDEPLPLLQTEDAQPPGGWPGRTPGSCAPIRLLLTVVLQPLAGPWSSSPRTSCLPWPATIGTSCQVLPFRECPHPPQLLPL